eukprot:SAG11_NODE_8071_length_1062_cov_47.727934_1_plen_223_part_00
MEPGAAAASNAPTGRYETRLEMCLNKKPPDIILFKTLMEKRYDGKPNFNFDGKLATECGLAHGNNVNNWQRNGPPKKHWLTIRRFMIDYERKLSGGWRPLSTREQTPMYCEYATTFVWKPVSWQHGLKEPEPALLEPVQFLYKSLPLNSGHTRIKFVQKNPQKKDTKAFVRYEKYKQARTVDEFMELCPDKTVRSLDWTTAYTNGLLIFMMEPEPEHEGSSQ